MTGRGVGAMTLATDFHPTPIRDHAGECEPVAERPDRSEGATAPHPEIRRNTGCNPLAIQSSCGIIKPDGGFLIFLVPAR